MKFATAGSHDAGLGTAGIVALEAAQDLQIFGGKGVHLGAATRAGLPVPGGFALSVHALSQLVAADPDVTARVLALCAELRGPFAARSSAIGEDSAEASFAGQYLTLLNLATPAAVVDGLERVHESAQAPAVVAYRKKKGITGPVQIAAVVQKLVDPLCAGVLFTRNPVTGAEEYVIEGTWGLGEAVVAGLVTPDHHRLARDGRVLEARLGDKDIAIRRAADGGTLEVPVDDAMVQRFCLDERRLAQLYELARRCEAGFGAGLDLEWAFVADELFLLQLRPISTGRGGRENASGASGSL